MKERTYGKPVEELPDDLREIIRREVEKGLAGFGSKDFDSAMRARLRPAAREAPRRFQFLPVAPAVALALAILIIGAAVLWFTKSRSSPAGPGFLALSLEISPGLVNLREHPLAEKTAEAGQASPAADLVGRALLSAATEAAASSAGPRGEGTIKPVPRTSLEQKMKLLYGDRMIERALESFREEFKED